MAVTSLGPNEGSGTGSTLLAFLDDGRRTFLVLALLFVAVVLLQFALPANHDVGWYLHSAQAFLAGGTLYHDAYLEMNLPLPVMLSVPPAAVSEATGLFIVYVFRVYVFAWILLSCWLGWRVTDGLLPDRQRRALMVFFLAAIGLLTLDHFGQREHFLMITILPYLLLAARRVDGLDYGRAEASVIGAFAAVGFALKPHFLLVLLLVEGYLLWRRRKVIEVFRSDTLALAGVGLGYLALVIALTPTFFTLIAPMALDLYHAYNKPMLGVIVVVPAPVLLFALFIHWHNRRSLKTSSLTDILCLSALALFTIYLVQKKGWPYHLYPTAACLVMFWGATLCAERRPIGAGVGPAKAVVRSAALACLVLFGAGAGYGAVAIHDQGSYLARMVPALRKHAEGETFHFLTTSLSASFPLTHYSGVRMVSRFPMLWPVAGLQSYANGVAPIRDAEHLAQIEAYETYLFDAVVTDLTRSRPKVVIVDERPKKPFIFKFEARVLEWEVEQTFYDLDYIEYFSSDPRFQAFWADYEVVDRLGHFTIFARP